MKTRKSISPISNGTQTVGEDSKTLKSFKGDIFELTSINEGGELRTLLRSNNQIFLRPGVTSGVSQALINLGTSTIPATVIPHAANSGALGTNDLKFGDVYTNRLNGIDILADPVATDSDISALRTDLGTETQDRQDEDSNLQRQIDQTVKLSDDQVISNCSKTFKNSALVFQKTSDNRTDSKIQKDTGGDGHWVDDHLLVQGWPNLVVASIAGNIIFDSASNNVIPNRSREINLGLENYRWLNVYADKLHISMNPSSVSNPDPSFVGEVRGAYQIYSRDSGASWDDS